LDLCKAPPPPPPGEIKEEEEEEGVEELGERLLLEEPAPGLPRGVLKVSTGGFTAIRTQMLAQDQRLAPSTNWLRENPTRAREYTSL